MLRCVFCGAKKCASWAAAVFLEKRTGQGSWWYAFSVTANTDGKCRAPCYPGHPQRARDEPLPIPGRASHHPLRTRYNRRHVERGCLSGRHAGTGTRELFFGGGELFGHALKLWANRARLAPAAQTNKTAPCAVGRPSCWSCPP
jgi:hypothetical protein